MSKDGSLRYVALKSGEDTTLRAVRTSDGSVAMSQPFAGLVRRSDAHVQGPGGGLFRDGSTLVLQSTGYAANTTFQLVSAGDLALGEHDRAEGDVRVRRAVARRLEALSDPAHVGRTISSTTSCARTTSSTHTLLPGKIADKTQKGWVMQGFPVARATTADGRWAYTMYWNPSGYPFVHALDTVRGVAHCVGFAATSPSGALVDYKLAVKGRQADDPDAQRRAVPRHRPDDVEGDEAVRNVSIAARDAVGLAQRQVVI